MQGIVEVGAKRVVFHHRLQVPICGSDQTGVGADRAIAANTLELLVLNGTQ